MPEGYIHSIETCATVDGPGLRYALFFQGCIMRCLYCHNPDTWRPNCGTRMTASEALDRFYRNLPFYKNGGVTATGGEPMMQMEFLTEIFETLHRDGIHTCLDTSGILFNPDDEAQMAKTRRLLDSTDLVMLDIKHMDDDIHRTLTGHSNRNVLAFAEYLDRRKVPVWIRHVIVRGITTGREHLRKLGEFMGGLGNIQALDVLSYHSMGMAKYEKLGIEYPLKDIPETTAAEAKECRRVILEAYHLNHSKQRHS